MRTVTNYSNPCILSKRRIFVRSCNIFITNSHFQGSQHEQSSTYLIPLHISLKMRCVEDCSCVEDFRGNASSWWKCCNYISFSMRYVEAVCTNSPLHISFSLLRTLSQLIHTLFQLSHTHTTLPAAGWKGGNWALVWKRAGRRAPPLRRLCSWSWYVCVCVCMCVCVCVCVCVKERSDCVAYGIFISYVAYGIFISYIAYGRLKRDEWVTSRMGYSSVMFHMGNITETLESAIALTGLFCKRAL